MSGDSFVKFDKISAAFRIGLQVSQNECGDTTIKYAPGDQYEMYFSLNAYEIIKYTN